MTEMGRYGDGREYALPGDWMPLAPEVSDTVVSRARAALANAGDALGRYYDRELGFTGTLFLDVEPHDPSTITASDLYAVTTLSIELDPRHGRLLLDPGDVRSGVQRQLAALDPEVPITDLEHGDGGSVETLTRMWELQHRFRTLLHEDGNAWVTAAKFCARKRPLLFPVRDNRVCVYLGGGRPLKQNNGWPGNFSVDIQTYALLMTTPGIRDELDRLRAEVESRGTRVDVVDLRLLDAALWMGTLRHTD